MALTPEIDSINGLGTALQEVSLESVCLLLFSLFILGNNRGDRYRKDRKKNLSLARPDSVLPQTFAPGGVSTISSPGRHVIRGHNSRGFQSIGCGIPGIPRFFHRRKSQR